MISLLNAFDKKVAYIYRIDTNRIFVFRSSQRQAFICFKMSLIAVAKCHFCGGIKQASLNKGRNKNDTVSTDKKGQIGSINVIKHKSSI